MGRRKTPTAILEAQGSFDRHPERRRARNHEPVPAGPVGDPPDYFDRTHRNVWAELVNAAPRGVLALSDSPNLEIATRLMVKMRLAPGRMPKWMTMLGKLLKTLGWDAIDIAEMQDAFRTALGINGQELTILRATLSSMGMTPADRPRVHASSEAEPKEIDPLEKAMQALSRVKPLVQ